MRCGIFIYPRIHTDNVSKYVLTSMGDDVEAPP